MPQATSPIPVIDLPGGSKLIVQTDRKAPLVSIRTVIDGGQRAEPQGKEGLVQTPHLSLGHGYVVTQCC